MWFVSKKLDIEQEVKEVAEKGCDREVTQSPLGRCRRHAPVVQHGWPAVFDADWCGDHKLDEGKL